ncbi:MAG: hydrogenase iron-sulfur subunit [Phycisphaerae bacterium]
MLNLTDSTTAVAPDTAAAAFEPRIVAFVCKWCTYAGADLAGTSRMVYPPNVRTLMLPCTGRIDTSFVLRAFLQGADGVLVSGCHPGDCHYTAGNFRARRRWTLFRDLLDVIGFDLNRLEIAWVSAAEGAKWVKIITEFTEKIRNLGPYHDMRRVASDHVPPIAPPAGGHGTVVSRDRQGAEARARPQLHADRHVAGGGNGRVRAPAQLTEAATEALRGGKVNVILGWVRNRTLGQARPTWIAQPEAAADLVAPGDAGNLARLLKRPEVRALLPAGIVARAAEVMALNVLAQEAQLDPAKVFLFVVAPDGRYLGLMDLAEATERVVADNVKGLDDDRPAGFSDETLAALDELMARLPRDRWQFWAAQFEKCIKCYACRGSCPLCDCETCFADRNQPQWFPTGSDGPGNLGWHVIRAFHLAGRCVGCGACQEACPAGIPLNLMGAALSRSALRHFGHRAGVSSRGVPLQSDYRTEDGEAFIL